jgi:hypothetical protein
MPGSSGGRKSRRPDLVKVRFELDPNAWHGVGTETLWAEAMGADRYRLQNSPFYAKDVSFEDVVLARPNQRGELVVERPVVRSGRSTYRIIPGHPVGSPEFERLWARLSLMGCTYEGTDGSLLAVDVPPSADIFAVYAVLEEGEAGEVWSFEEGHCGHPT